MTDAFILKTTVFHSFFYRLDSGILLGFPIVAETDPHSPSGEKISRLRYVLGAGGLIYLLLAILLGVLSGLGVFTFGYGQGASYLSNNPQSCMKHQ